MRAWVINPATQGRLWRILLVTGLGATNSEILFGNMRPLQFLADPWVWLIYIPMLVLVDELVIRKQLGTLYILLSGAIFGFVLEGLMMGMMHEGGGMLTMVMLWHMFFTILLTQCVADLLVSRDNLTHMPRWLIIALLCLTAALCSLFMYSRTFGIIMANPVAVSIAAVTSAIAAWLLYRHAATQAIAPKPALSLILIGSGFAIGCIFINIMDQEVGRSPYTLPDHAIRSGIYLLLANLIIYVWRRAGRKAF